MITDKEVMKHLKALIAHTDKWYIDSGCPEDSEFIEILDKAKTYATDKLTNLSLKAIYERFKRWEASGPIIAPNDDYFREFFNHLVFSLGREGLKRTEKLLYEESCWLEIKFN